MVIAMKRKDGRETHLLDYLTEQSGCEYLSDLRHHEKVPWAQLAVLVENLPAEAAERKEWNDALVYLFHAPLELSAELAREELLTRLRDQRKGGELNW